MLITLSPETLLHKYSSNENIPKENPFAWEPEIGSKKVSALSQDEDKDHIKLKNTSLPKFLLSVKRVENQQLKLKFQTVSRS